MSTAAVLERQGWRIAPDPERPLLQVHERQITHEEAVASERHPLRCERLRACAYETPGPGESATEPLGNTWRLSDEDSARAAELSDVLDQCHALMAATERRFVEAAREMSRIGGYRIDGAVSMAEWLAERYSMSRSRARGIVDVATKLEQLPEMAAKYEEGELSIDQLRPLVSVADEHTDAMFADRAPGWTEAECRSTAAMYRKQRERGEIWDRTKRAFRGWFADDHYRFRGSLSIEDGAAVEAALHRVAGDDGREPETGIFVPFQARASDALVEICSAELGERQRNEADVATVVCHVDAATLAGLDGDAEIEPGRKIAGETARRLACDSRFQIVTENENGEPLGLGRMTRVVPPWMRRQLRRRDRGCRFPGCSRVHRMHRHHIVFWADGGRTDMSNLIQLCRIHHRFLHELGWRIEGDPSGELRFVSPDGRAATSRPAPPRPDVLERFGLWDGGPAGSPDPEPDARSAPGIAAGSSASPRSSPSDPGHPLNERPDPPRRT